MLGLQKECHCLKAVMTCRVDIFHALLALVQSSESGGHGASSASLLSLIPELVDHVEDLCQKLNIQPAVPVAAAGGISDARQVQTHFVPQHQHEHDIYAVCNLTHSMVDREHLERF